MLHIVTALNYYTFVSNVILVLVQVVKIALVRVDNSCKYELITVKLKLFDGKALKFVLFKMET